MSLRSSVFISYSHRDRAIVDRLRIHLRPLERHFPIEIWDDTHISPGSRWRDEIRGAIDRAKVAILLVSADFLASDFIATDELPPLLDAARQEGTIVLPVVVAPCRFDLASGLADFQAVNDPSIPLSSMGHHDQEMVLVKLSKSVEETLAPRLAVPQQPRTAETIPADPLNQASSVVEAVLQQAHSNLSEGKTTLAEVAVRRALSAEPDSTRLRIFLLKMLRGHFSKQTPARDRSEQEKLMSWLRTHSPDNQEVVCLEYESQLEASYESRDWEEGKRIGRQALESCFDNFLIHFYFSLAVLKYGDTEGLGLEDLQLALSHMRISADIRPDFSPAALNVGSIQELVDAATTD